MSDPLSKVRPGEKLRIPADAYNAFVDAARYVQSRQVAAESQGTPTTRSSGIILIKNNSGANRARFEVLGVEQPVFGPDENLDEFKNRYALAGVTPSAKTHFGRFVVLLEPIAAGAIGRAWAAGVCPVKVTIPDRKHTYRFADVRDGDCGGLLAGPQGAAFILWHEDVASSGGEVWAVVRLVAPIFQFFALDDCDDELPTLYVTNDLTDDVGKVVLVEDTCYTVRVPDPGEIECLQPKCVEIQARYNDCDRCKGCWKLTPCDDTLDVIITNSDLSAYEDAIVKLEDGNCYTVTLAKNCLEAKPVVVKDHYYDCDSCTHCYHLQNCFDESDTLVIDNDLAREFEKTPDQIVAGAYVVEVAGQCYTVVGYDTTCPDVQTAQIDGLYPSCGDCGCFKLTPCSGDSPAIYARRATGPDGGAVSLRYYLDRVIRLADGQCYTLEQTSDCTSLQEVSAQAAYDDCSACKCYLLTDCDDGETTITTFSDLSAYGVGSVVKQKDSGDPGKCYTITSETEWSPEAQKFVVDNDYPDCDTCLGRKKYQLTTDCTSTDCDNGGGGGGEPDILTTEDLHAAVGQYVKANGYCYKVQEVADGDVTDKHLSYQGPYSTCEDCLGSPLNTKKRYVTNIKIDGTNLVAETEEMVIKDGLIVAFCKGDDITIDGTDCPGQGG